MSIDISGRGVILTLIASQSAPGGFLITEFPEDVDPYESEAIEIAETAKGLNGTLISWSRAVNIPIKINVIPGSDSDRTLKIIGDNNFPSADNLGRPIVKDVMTLVLTHPDGLQEVLQEGKMTKYSPVIGTSGSGRRKSQSYEFMFESRGGDR